MKTLKIILGVILGAIAVAFLAPFIAPILVGLGWTIAPVLVAGIIIKIVWELIKANRKKENNELHSKGH